MFRTVAQILLLAMSALLTAQAQSSTSDWDKASPNGLLSEEKLRAMDAAVRSGEFKKIGSILIARHGKLVFEGYFDGDAGTLRDTRSATKTITGALVGIALKEGKLSGVDAKVLPLLPEHAQKIQNADPRKQNITIEDLLTMSSPLECDDWNDASRGNEERMYLVEDWTQFILDLPIRGRMHTGEKAEPPPYGRYFSYCTGGVFMLGDLLQRATGIRTDHYAHDKLFAPLRINNVQWVYSPLNIPQTGGGLRLTSRDLLKIAQLYLDSGRWRGSSILDEAWVKRSIQPHAQIDENTDYGYLWWLKSFRSGANSYPAFFMSGNGGNKILGFPTLDMAVAITSTNFNTKGMHEQTEKILTEYVLASVTK